MKSKNLFYSFFTLALSSFLLLPASALAQNTYDVTTTSGSTSVGSLGAAVASSAGDGASTSDTINFGSNSILMTLSYASLTKNAGTTVTVVGSGIGSSFLSGSASYYTPFDFAGGGTLHLTDMSIQSANISVGASSILELSGVRDFPGSVSITGSGGMLVNGGYNILDGKNNFTGGLTITGGATLAANSNSLGDDATTITLDGGNLAQGLQGLALQQTVTITANGGSIDAYEIDGDILGSHGVSLIGGTGGSAMTIVGTKNYTGDSWISGTISLFQSDSLGSGPATLFFNDGGLNTTASVTLSQDVNITNGLTLNGYFHDNALNGVISGSGLLTVDNGGNYGSWTLTSANSYSGGTTVNAGTLVLAGSGTLGTGALGLAANGNFDISGASTPVTVISVTGAGKIDLGAGQLVFGSDNSDMSLSGIISGTGGTLVKNGSGALTLTGANSFTGGLLFNSGDLLVGNASGLGAGSVTMSGGMMSFTGGPRTVDVGGNYVQDAPATLKLGLANAFPYDQLEVAGQARLGGTLQLFNYSTFDPVPGQSFLMLQSTGGISGHFASVTDSFTNVRILPVYYPNELLMLAVVPSFTQLAVTPNQKSVAAALDGAFGNPDSQNLVASLGVQSSSSLPASYDQIAPTGLLPVFQMGFVTAQAQASLVTRRFSEDDGEVGPSSIASRWGHDEVLFASTLSARQEAALQPQISTQDGWGLFVERQSVSSSVVGDADSPGYQFTSNGLTAGLDRRLSRNLSAGLFFSYGQSGTIPGGSGSVNATDGQAGLYGGWHEKGAYIEASAMAGLNRYQTQRLGYGGYAAGNSGGYRLSGQVGAGFDQDWGPTKVGLFGSGQYTYVGIDAFTETGSLAPLSFSSQGERSVLSDLGARTSRRFTLGDLAFDPGLSLAWEHRYEGSADSLSSGFSGGSSFATEGPATWTDGVSVGAKLGVRFAQVLNFSLQFTDLVGIGNGGSQGFSSGVDLGF